MSLIEHLQSTPLDWISILFLFALLTEIIYFYAIFYKIVLHKDRPIEEVEQWPPVSIIICAKNERDNIINNLPLILEQNYPDFEVIVVNDASTDDTEDILKGLTVIYPNLKYTFSTENDEKYFSKKRALTIGIKKSQHNHLLLTDADCRPSSKNWIKHMMASYQNNTEIVLGYSPYIRQKGWLNDWIRFDTYYIAMQYLGFAKTGIPYMGVGRNLSYKKTLFFNKKGFATHLDLESGDDDLFVNQAANRHNTTVCLAEDAFVFSIPKNNLTHWLIQKRRHSTTGSRYKTIHKFLLAYHHINYHLMFALLLISLFFYQNHIYLALTVLILRYILVLPVFYSTMKKLKVADIFLFSLFWEFVNKWFYVYLYIRNRF
ncbi:MAG: glycosyl transferase family 2 [Vicingaceae bacterium]|nr:MAG: glycosyl transferase family 2 [Vicingaceae bacterium]